MAIEDDIYVSELAKRMLAAEIPVSSDLFSVLLSGVESGKLSIYEAFGIARCVVYSDSIPAESVGNVWRDSAKRTIIEKGN